MEKLLKKGAQEAVTYGLIAVDLVLGFFTWLLVTGLVPGDAVDFNMVGSLVLFGICVLPWLALDRYVQKRVNNQN